MAGTLFVVATPIGNLEDLTFRALRVLREVALIAAEDTRRTAKLLAHYEIRCPMVSLHAHNEFREAPGLVARLVAGTSVALVSDAGTPGIADPGARLVRLAREAGVTVVPLPGASAVATALSATGLEADEFVFLGFVPAKGREREVWFDRLEAESRVVVFFESPHRIRRTLIEIRNVVKRQIFVFRELTKINEILVVEHNSQADIQGDPPGQSLIPELGEFTLVIGPADSSVGTSIVEVNHNELLDIFGRLTDLAHIDPDDATAMCAARFGVTVPHTVKLLKKARIARKEGRLPA